MLQTPEIPYLRKEIIDFAFAMENEMRRKDAKNYLPKDKSIEYLIDKLKEERNEVDECYVKNRIPKLIDEELLHEGIMLVLIRNKLIKSLGESEDKLKCPECEKYFTFDTDKLSKNEYCIENDKLWFSCPLCGKLLNMNLKE